MSYMQSEIEQQKWRVARLKGDLYTAQAELISAEYMLERAEMILDAMLDSEE